MNAASPIHATHCADNARFIQAEILENEPVAQDTFRLRVEAAEIAARIVPGQFVMIRLAGVNDPLLGRALALYDVSASRAAIDVVYLRMGKLTRELARRQPGDAVELWGPLGNGFVLPAADRLVMVAGGIGQTPMLALGKEALGVCSYGRPSRTAPRFGSTVLCYGVRNASLLAGADDFRAAGIDLRIASDDGSIGRHGLVTELLVEALQECGDQSVVVATCGPEPMMARVAEICADRGVLCFASLETPMACGIGICFSCVAPVRQQDGGWDYKRTCVEGPVFDAASLVWE
ncbi:Dihydroorotate dehydrogenase B (NAD(+)), electron transfer subunit [Pirellulimonas nuda]|uniref:Dihydroorotate dehydrogenase B (NAD(+)), electron transfer subunit n=1 Tax=Pirellulimonas nuda TaxID=2528009 RepID=A0A518D7Z2_9BACT|nr:dihydroorotate dehydrogenase electron transfer subunit [Pirellulimonas nuda]QDU87606.1 Dihydroorotate dehydrogenase B (NAD(+)), electron transfer subunit [Pirellulimonas nuda]